MEYGQRGIIRFLLNENANADDIHRKLQKQFTDDVHDKTRSGRSPIDFIDAKIFPALERAISFSILHR
jgi:hypothetical protein